MKSILLILPALAALLGACRSAATNWQAREERSSRLVVEGLICRAGCPARIESALRRVPGVRLVAVEAVANGSERAVVTVTGKANADELAAALEGTPYRVKLD